MRVSFFIGGIALTLLVAGCSDSNAPSAAATKSPVAPAASAVPAARAPVPTLHLHFSGTASLRTNSHAAKLNTLAAIPTVQAQWNTTLDAFAKNAPRLIGWQLDAKPDPARLRPLLDDLFQHGASLIWSESTAGASSFALTVRLPAERTELWKKNLAAWFAPGQPTAIRSLLGQGLEGWETQVGATPWRLVQEGDCLILSMGTQTSRSATEVLKELTPPDHLGMGTNWLAVTANPPATERLGKLTRGLSRHWIESAAGRNPAAAETSPSEWPDLQLTLTSLDDHVRTQLRLNYARPVPVATSEWRVPVKTMNAAVTNLISFTALQAASATAQRLLPWLGPQDFLPLAELEAHPAQAYAWGLAQVPFQSYIAVSLDDATNAMGALQERLQTRWGGVLASHALGQLRFDEATRQLNWQGGLPMIVPFLAPAADAGYVVAGIFPMPPVPQPPPQELIAQIEGRTNLLYYNWEITEGRLVQWRLMDQFLSMLRPVEKAAAGVPAPPMFPSPMGTTDLRWLNELGAQLGNTVTEVIAELPTSLLLRRKSHSGLTALEWVILSRWLGSPAFPEFIPEKPISSVPAMPVPPTP